LEYLLQSQEHIVFKDFTS